LTLTPTNQWQVYSSRARQTEIWHAGWHSRPRRRNGLRKRHVGGRFLWKWSGWWLRRQRYRPVIVGGRRQKAFSRCKSERIPTFSHDSNVRIGRALPHDCTATNGRPDGSCNGAHGRPRTSPSLIASSRLEKSDEAKRASLSEPLSRQRYTSGTER
jgi:hypothetical protein